MLSPFEEPKDSLAAGVAACSPSRPRMASAVGEVVWTELLWALLDITGVRLGYVARLFTDPEALNGISVKRPGLRAEVIWSISTTCKPETIADLA